MPQVQVVLYKEDDGTVPVLEWLDELPVTHGLTKEREVPLKEIDKVLTSRRRFEASPESHTVLWET